MNRRDVLLFVRGIWLLSSAETLWLPKLTNAIQAIVVQRLRNVSRRQAIVLPANL